MTTKFGQIWKSLEDEEMRREFNLDVDTGLAFQIRALREKNGWTQAQLGERAGGKRQKVISDWENPNYGRYSLQSLKSLATAFDVGLMVRFVPFSELVHWNANLTPARIAPPSFKDEDSVFLGMHYYPVPQAPPPPPRTEYEPGDLLTASATTVPNVKVETYEATTTIPTWGKPKEAQFAAQFAGQGGRQADDVAA